MHVEHLFSSLLSSFICSFIFAEGADEPPVPHVSGKHVQAFVDAEVKDSPMNNDRPADSKHIDYRLLDTNEKNEKMSTGESLCFCFCHDLMFSLIF